MGLDMYLYADIYVPGGYNHIRESSNAAHQKAAARFDGILSLLDIDRDKLPTCDYINVQIEVAYWRKANAVHAWFVRETQGGVDECRESDVSREQLAELKDIVDQLLDTVDLGDPVTRENIFGEYQEYPDATIDADLAEELLPPQSGFFFGSTDLDYWYIQDLQHTQKAIDAILTNPALNDADFTYRASW